MPKNRTKILVVNQLVPEPTESKKSTSMFLVTINPNIRYDDINSPEAKKMMARLQGLANFLLKKKNILASLKFKDRPAKEGETQLVQTREQHLSKIVSISDDRSGAVEWGSKFHRLHIHVEFIIEHRTFIHLNKEFYEKAASIFLGKPEKNIHVNLRGATRAEGYKKYVGKNDKESTPHFFDNAATQFYNETSRLLE